MINLTIKIKVFCMTDKQTKSLQAKSKDKMSNREEVFATLIRARSDVLYKEHIQIEYRTKQNIQWKSEPSTRRRLLRKQNKTQPYLREIQIKTTPRHHFFTLQIDKDRKGQLLTGSGCGGEISLVVGKGLVILAFSCIAGGNGILSVVGNLAISAKCFMHIDFDPASLLPINYPTDKNTHV